ncbi:MAG: DoxX family protein [Bacteroidota bacterium]
MTSQKKYKIGFWISTGLLTALMLLSVGNYFFNYTEISKAFQSFGYPTYIIYPLAVLKLLGVAAIWSRFQSVVTEWAYAGFFFNFTLAFFAHLMIGDGQQFGALIALILLLTSRFTSGKAFNS